MPSRAAPKLETFDWPRDGRAKTHAREFNRAWNYYEGMSDD